MSALPRSDLLNPPPSLLPKLRQKAAEDAAVHRLMSIFDVDHDSAVRALARAIDIAKQNEAHVRRIMACVDGVSRDAVIDALSAASGKLWDRSTGLEAAMNIIMANGWPDGVERNGLER